MTDRHSILLVVCMLGACMLMMPGIIADEADAEEVYSYQFYNGTTYIGNCPSDAVSIPTVYDVQEGMKLAGWSLTPDGETVDVYSYVPTGNTSFYAVFTPIETGGGSGDDGLTVTLLIVLIAVVGILAVYLWTREH